MGNEVAQCGGCRVYELEPIVVTEMDELLMGAITCKPSGYLTAFEVGLHSKSMDISTDRKMAFQSEGTSVCLYVAALRCVYLWLAREERRVV